MSRRSRCFVRRRSSPLPCASVTGQGPECVVVDNSRAIRVSADGFQEAREKLYHARRPVFRRHGCFMGDRVGPLPCRPRTTE
jgi:hypothetical protein